MYVHIYIYIEVHFIFHKIAVIILRREIPDLLDSACLVAMVRSSERTRAHQCLVIIAKRRLYYTVITDHESARARDDSADRPTICRTANLMILSNASANERKSEN